MYEKDTIDLKIFDKWIINQKDIEVEMMANEHLNGYLNELVATWSVLYTKLHNYHWYVNGSSFFTLHEKFEELYDAVTLNLDEVAERILSTGGKPVAT